MAFTPTQEAQLLELINQQAALLSLASNEASITSALGAEQVNLSELTPATTIADADLLLVRQGVTDKSTSVSILKSGLLADSSVTTAKIANDAVTAAKIAAGAVGTGEIANDAVTFAKIQNIATARVLGRTTAGSGDVEELTTLPAVSGVNLTALNASNLASGAVPAARLPAATETAIGALEIATASESQAGTSDTVAITPLKLRQGLNASGTAPIYACRAWVNFNGTGTVAIRASGNVSSITDNGEGDYTVNFATAMPDANYSAVGSAKTSNTASSADADRVFMNFYAFSASSIGVTVLRASASSTSDAINNSIAIFR